MCASIAKTLQSPELIEEKKIPATLVLGILVLYTALGGVLMSHLEPWNFFVSFYYSFITMTTVSALIVFFCVGIRRSTFTLLFMGSADQHPHHSLQDPRANIHIIVYRIRVPTSTS